MNAILILCWLGFAAPQDAPPKTDAPSAQDEPLSLADQWRAERQAAFEKERLEKIVAIEKPTALALIDIARWCEDEGEDDAALKTYRQALELEPQNALASAGIESLEAEIAAEAERRAEREQAKIDHVVAKERREARREMRRLQLKMNALLREIAYGSKERSDRALKDVIGIAREVKNRDLAEKAYQVQKAFDVYWAQVREQQTVLADVRLTHAELKRPIQTFSTGLGTGSPVTLQLPERRVVSVQTTVAIPAGRGR
ncbi:MAG: hypothetical protein RL885_09185 [Planctomycetota bacterium]